MLELHEFKCARCLWSIWSFALTSISWKSCVGEAACAGLKQCAWPSSLQLLWDSVSGKHRIAVTACHCQQMWWCLRENYVKGRWLKMEMGGMGWGKHKIRKLDFAFFSGSLIPPWRNATFERKGCAAYWEISCAPCYSLNITYSLEVWNISDHKL